MTMYARWLCHTVWRLIPAVLSVMLLGACTVPEHMRVRAGIDPRNQDDHVRFRSTYYFRVFDVCRNPASGQVNGPPWRDSLYRFRMTGKANSFLSQVHFESGTLHKDEIDPFGSNVVFDKNLGRYRFVSREETDAATRRNERYDEIRRLLKLLKEFPEILKEPDVQAATDEVKKLITKEVEQLIKKLPNGIENPTANLDPSTTDSQAKDNSPQDKSDQRDGNTSPPDNSNAKGCPNGTELKRGFQIMGPEGISTFNQNQRLVMAMTSSGKPLIGALKELSGHMLAKHGSVSNLLLPLAQENIAILRAKRVVEKLEGDTEGKIDEAKINDVIDAFNQDAPPEAQ